MPIVLTVTRVPTPSTHIETGSVASPSSARSLNSHTSLILPLPLNKLAASRDHHISPTLPTLLDIAGDRTNTPAGHVLSSILGLTRVFINQ